MTGRSKAAAAVLVGLSLWVGGCTKPPPFPPRTRVGSVPEGFITRPIASAADAASYVEDYSRALGLDNIDVVRVLGFTGVYWVYAVEADTGRAAFALEVQANGEIASKRFPAMEPEMMWNQKYGHEARPDPADIEEKVSPEEAEALVQKTLPEAAQVRPGKPSDYYGYVLFPLCEGNRPVGEAAVNEVNRKVAWKRFPETPRSTWYAPGAPGSGCD